MTDKTVSENIKKVVQIQSVEETADKYDHWDDYEEEMRKALYKGPQLAAEEFSRLELDKKALILDVGAGTGLLGQELHRKGYKNLVALEPSDIIDKAKASGTYTSYVKDYVKKGHKLPISKSTFDAVVMCGVMVPGHMHVEDLIELIPLVKKGGLICWTRVLNDDYADVDSRYRSSVCQEVLQEFINEGLLRMFRDPVTLVDYYQGREGLFYVVEVM